MQKWFFPHKSFPQPFYLSIFFLVFLPFIPLYSIFCVFVFYFLGWRGDRRSYLFDQYKISPTILSLFTFSSFLIIFFNSLYVFTSIFLGYKGGGDLSLLDLSLDPHPRKSFQQPFYLSTLSSFILLFILSFCVSLLLIFSSSLVFSFIGAA